MADNFWKNRNGISLGNLASAPSNPINGDFYYDTTMNKFQKYENGSWGSFGAGSGSAINYITASDAETGTTGWATYADAAAATPVDGTGGSPNVTWTASSSSPLRGTQSFIFTKDAANRQGQGVGYAFTIDSADKGRLLTGSIDYTPATGTYADGDLIVAVYDVTNAVLIPVYGSVIPTGTTGANLRQVFQFQASSTSTSYRLILHVATTSAVAYTVKMDNFIVGPQTIQVGAPVTDWVAYTPTFNGLGSPTNINMFWRRVGDSMEIKGSWTNGTISAAAVRISLPSGYSVDSTKTGSASFICGSITCGDAASGNHIFNGALVFVNGGTGSNLSVSNIANGSVTRNLSEVVATEQYSSSVSQSLFACVPITGWSSNVNMSASSRTTPTQQRFTSGSGTYTTPAGVKYLKVRMVGGGGGGAGSGTAAGPGSAGGAGSNTTFGSSLLTANGGGASGAGSGSVGGGGGSYTIASPAFGSGWDGGNGGGASEFAAADNHGSYHASGHGGVSQLGGMGAIPAANQPGLVGKANTGSGGSGGNKQATGSVVTDAGAGGGAGGFIDAYIPSPAATYAYSVGGGGSAGGAGTSGLAGAAGGSGYIEVTEFYANEGSLAFSGDKGYFSGYFTDASQWTTTSATFVDGTNTGGNALTTSESVGLGTVAAAASNVAGITLTPSSATAAYRVTASFVGDSTGNVVANFRLFDGTKMIATGGVRPQTGSDRSNLTLVGIWKPGTTASSTIKVQLAATGGSTAEIIGQSLPGVVIWFVIEQIAN